jgi:5'-deoxynucleotidase YfbR-like HD superfamily hydrolase
MNLDWIRKAREGAEVDRMHTIPTLRQYPVGQHTFNAIVIALELAQQQPVLRPDLVVKYLIAHDLSEGYTGDIPANVKMENDGVRDLLHVIERRWTERNVPEYLKKAERNIHQTERTLAKAADLLELVLFCVEEREMGNLRTTRVYNNALKYLAPLKEIPGVNDLILHAETRMEKANYGT